jgi:hypothetical protein
VQSRFVSGAELSCGIAIPVGADSETKIDGGSRKGTGPTISRSVWSESRCSRAWANQPRLTCPDEPFLKRRRAGVGVLISCSGRSQSLLQELRPPAQFSRFKMGLKGKIEKRLTSLRAELLTCNHNRQALAADGFFPRVGVRLPARR